MWRALLSIAPGETQSYGELAGRIGSPAAARAVGIPSRLGFADVRNHLASDRLLEVMRTDLFVFANLSMDTLDYTGPQVNEGSKGVWLGLGEPA